MMPGPIRLLPVDLYEAQQRQTDYVPPSMITPAPRPLPPPPATVNPHRTTAIGSEGEEITTILLPPWTKMLAEPELKPQFLGRDVTMTKEGYTESGVVIAGQGVFDIIHSPEYLVKSYWNVPTGFTITKTTIPSGYEVFTKEGEPTGETVPIGKSVFDKALGLPAVGTESRLEKQGKTLFITTTTETPAKSDWWYDLTHPSWDVRQYAAMQKAQWSGQAQTSFLGTAFMFGGGPLISGVEILGTTGAKIAASALGRTAIWGALGGWFGGVEARLRGEDVVSGTLTGAAFTGAFSIGTEFAIKGGSWIARTLADVRGNRLIKNAIGDLAGGSATIKTSKFVTIRGEPSGKISQYSEWFTPSEMGATPQVGKGLKYREVPSEISDWFSLEEIEGVKGAMKSETFGPKVNIKPDEPPLVSGIKQRGASFQELALISPQKYRRLFMNEDLVLEHYTMPEDVGKIKNPSAVLSGAMTVATAFSTSLITVPKVSVGVSQLISEIQMTKPVTIQTTIPFQTSMQVSKQYQESIPKISQVQISDLRTSLVTRQDLRQMLDLRTDVITTTTLSTKQTYRSRLREEEDLTKFLLWSKKSGRSYEERRNPFNIKFLKDIGKIDRRWT